MSCWNCNSVGAYNSVLLSQRTPYHKRCKNPPQYSLITVWLAAKYSWWRKFSTLTTHDFDEFVISYVSEHLEYSIAKTDPWFQVHIHRPKNRHLLSQTFSLNIIQFRYDSNCSQYMFLRPCIFLKNPVCGQNIRCTQFRCKYIILIILE